MFQFYMFGSEKLKHTNPAYFRAPTDAEFNKYVSKMDYDNGYDMHYAASPRQYGIMRVPLSSRISTVYPLTGEPLQTKHVIDGVEYVEDRREYSGRIGKYDTRRSFPSFACFIYEHGWRVGVFNEQGFHV